MIWLFMFLPVVLFIFWVWLLIRLLRLRKISRPMFLLHKHDWERREGQGGKRFCRKCGEEQWLMSRPYPAIGEPAVFWSPMQRITPPGKSK